MSIFFVNISVPLWRQDDFGRYGDRGNTRARDLGEDGVVANAAATLSLAIG